MGILSLSRDSDANFSQRRLPLLISTRTAHVFAITHQLNYCIFYELSNKIKIFTHIEDEARGRYPYDSGHLTDMICRSADIWWR